MIGNPDLSSTTIQNLMLGSIASFSGSVLSQFIQKELGDSSDPSDGPIERIIKSVNKQTQFVNQDYAEMIGFELEARKFVRIPSYLTGITVGANYTWLESEISVGALESDLMEAVLGLSWPIPPLTLTSPTTTHIGDYRPVYFITFMGNDWIQ